MFAAFKGSDLQHRVGLGAEGRSWRSDGTEGTLCYGPYIALQAGLYTAAPRLANHSARVSPGRINIEVVSGSGEVDIASSEFSGDAILAVPTRLYVDFSLDHDVSDLEVRIHVFAGTLVTLFDLTIYDRE